MKPREAIARIRLGSVIAMSFVSILQFSMVFYIFLALNYGKFQFLPYTAYIILSYIAFLIGFTMLAWYSQGSVYKGEVEYMIAILEEKGYFIGKSIQVEPKAKDPPQPPDHAEDGARPEDDWRTLQSLTHF